MARFRCRFCGEEGSTVFDPEFHACPECGSTDVQIAAVIEVSESCSFFEAMGRLADETEED